MKRGQTYATVPRRKTSLPVARYRKGTRLEHKTMDMLRAQGWSCLSARGSKGDGDVDIYAWRGEPCPEDTWRQGATGLHIQSKANRKHVGPAALKVFREGQCPPSVVKELWIWDDWAREPKIVVM